MQTAERMKPAPRTTRTRPNSVVVAMVVGLLLTVVATIVPFFTTALRDHIRASYPHYSDAHVDTAVSMWLMMLTVVGALAVVGWVLNIWTVLMHPRLAKWVATATFVVGTSIALAALLVKDTSGDAGLAPVLGWIGMLPWVAGLVAVALLWRRSS